MPWRAIFNSKWTIGGGCALLGMAANMAASFAPDAFWMHDNRQAISLLLANQPMMQRDITELRTGLSENTLAIKELTLALQKQQVNESHKRR